jgi:hypothetical protein
MVAKQRRHVAGETAATLTYNTISGWFQVLCLVLTSLQAFSNKNNI